MKPNLNRMETRIARLIEEPFVRLFAKCLLPHTVADMLARALEDAEVTLPDGRTAIPGAVQIYLHPDDWTALRLQDPAIDAHLSQALGHLANAMQRVLTGAADVRLLPDATLPLHTARIAFQSATPREATERLPARPASPPDSPPKAWLLLTTGQSFPLTHAVVRIGRALDNDLILEDPRVSRYHAQLRLRYGRYMLEDTGSSGGTQVNGYPVREVMLRSGDLISLGGYTLIYSEREQPAPPSAPSGTLPVPTLRER